MKNKELKKFFVKKNSRFWNKIRPGTPPQFTQDEFNFCLRKVERCVNGWGAFIRWERKRTGRSAKLKVSKARSYLTNVLASKETRERKRGKAEEGENVEVEKKRRGIG